MKPVTRRALLFSAMFALLFLSLPFLSMQFRLYPLMKMGDVVDMLTPLILIPLYWLLYRLDGRTTPTVGENVLFLVLAALWVEGQGMHLSANSIGHLLRDMTGSDAYELTNFYDEVLSHYSWHIGVVGLSVLIMFRQWRHPFAGERGALGITSVAGLIYGITYFIIFIEAGTAPLGVPLRSWSLCLAWSGDGRS